MLYVWLCLVLLASACAQPPPEVFDAQVIYNAFDSLGGGIFPLPNADFNILTSAFGPRIRTATNAYDFHRGVDLDAPLGTPVYAIYDGEFYGTRTYINGGQTVRLRHEFPAPLAYGPSGEPLRYFYTLYMHLDSYSPAILAASENHPRTPFKKGDLIGYVGETGSALDPHLHLDVRVGTICSLEYQLQNPGFSCADYGFDTHFHPHLLFAKEPQHMAMSLKQRPTKVIDGEVRIITPRAATIVNRIVVWAARKKNGQVKRYHRLDFNERLGFDATTTAALDTQDMTKPYISPMKLSGKEHPVIVIIPGSWLGKFANKKFLHGVWAFDTWNRKIELKWV
eukprot:m.221876 g.221876  ORF g.221876 m.221876 type:complete len:338 (-) comp26320_c0_seq2:142-1155(-)